ncbi:hypothetical protein S245_062306 [Arachis hypogaea]
MKPNMRGARPSKRSMEAQVFQLMLLRKLSKNSNRKLGRVLYLSKHPNALIRNINHWRKKKKQTWDILFVYIYRKDNDNRCADCLVRKSLELPRLLLLGFTS